MKNKLFALTVTTALLGTTALAQEVNFSDIDVNRDGILQQSELDAVFDEAGVNAILMLDRDGDGNVSWQEATDGSRDADNDEQDDPEDGDEVQSARGAAASEAKGDNRSDRGRDASAAGGDNRSDQGRDASAAGGDNRNNRDRDNGASAGNRGNDRGESNRDGNGRGNGGRGGN